MVASAAIDFPEPDSPTMQTISPRCTLKVRFLTAWDRSAPDGSAIVSPDTSSTGRPGWTGSMTLARIVSGEFMGEPSASSNFVSIGRVLAHGAADLPPIAEY